MSELETEWGYAYAFVYTRAYAYGYTFCYTLIKYYFGRVEGGGKGLTSSPRQ